MAYASKQGRARVNARSPEAAGVCDRCGFVYNFRDLRWQKDWGGATLINLRILVCDRCYDTPQEQDRSIVIPADPVPIVNARPQNYDAAETDYMTLSGAAIDPITGIPIPNTTIMVAGNGGGDFNDDFNDDFNIGTGVDRPMVAQPVGRPLGYTPAAQAPLVADARYAVRLPAVAIISSGGTVQVVTTVNPHGLSASSQVSIQNASVKAANGVYTVYSISSPTQFTYQTNDVIPAGSLLTARTRIVTMNIGIPIRLDELPQTGG